MSSDNHVCSLIINENLRLAHILYSSLPPAYSELESSKYNHMRSMSDDIVNSGSVAAEARTGRGRNTAKMTHPQADSQSTHGNATRVS